jgi:intracellular multiplication protein IcmE
VRAAKEDKDPNAIEAVGDTDRALLIKTGTIMYATLDAEVNTDDGGDVLATIRGGKWNGAKLIGKIEQAPDNIRVKFTILAPPVNDPRPTMRISAVALREDDAKQGIAETKDHHTMSRYFALGAASLLSGYGRAYQQTAGTTIISPSGVVAQTTTEPSTKQVIGSSVGEMGTAIASEVRRGFNRPATYATPANKGFGLFFLQDVHDQSR